MPSSYKVSAVASAFGPPLQENEEREGIELDEQPEDKTARQKRQNKHFCFIGTCTLPNSADNIRQPCTQSSFPQRKLALDQLGPPCMCSGIIRPVARLKLLRDAGKLSQGLSLLNTLLKLQHV